MKKINGKLYSIEKIVHENHSFRYVIDPNGYLFSETKYSTKITADDLPEWYVFGIYYRRRGYLSTKGVVDICYYPNKIFNHMLKDDFLVISYKDKIDKTKKNVSDLLESNCDVYLVYGGTILDVLKAINKYSFIDIKPVVEQIKDKQLWFKEKFPDDYLREASNFDLDKFFYNDGRDNE